MSRAGEILVFLGLAVGAHVGLWAGVTQSGSQAQGATGQASVTLMATTGEISEMVAAWSKPVEALDHMADQPALLQPETAALPVAHRPVSPATPQTPRQPTSQALPMPAPPQDAPPAFDPTSLKSSILERAPKASPRPTTRPVPKAAAKPAKQEPRPKPPKAASVKAQKATGGQSGNNAGAKQTQRSANLSKSARQSLMAEWGGAIRNRVERRKRYPKGTTASGTTVLRIAVSSAGRLAGVSVVRSSGDRKLDQAAIRAVQRATYPAVPKGLGAAQYKFNLPVTFTRG